MDNKKDFIIKGQLRTYQYKLKENSLINAASKEKIQTYNKDTYIVKINDYNQKWIFILYTPNNISQYILLLIPFDSAWGAYITEAKEILRDPNETVSLKKFKELTKISEGFNQRQKLNKFTNEDINLIYKNSSSLIEGLAYKKDNTNKPVYILHIQNIKNLKINHNQNVIRYSAKDKTWGSSSYKVIITKINQYTWRIKELSEDINYLYYIYNPTNAKDGILVIIPSYEQPLWKDLKDRIVKIITDKHSIQMENLYLNMIYFPQKPLDTVITPTLEISNELYIDKLNKGTLIQGAQLKSLSQSHNPAKIYHIDNIKDIIISGQVQYIKYSTKSHNWDIYQADQKIGTTKLINKYTWEFINGGSTSGSHYIIYSPPEQTDGILIEVPLENIWDPYFETLQKYLTTIHVKG